MTPAATLLRARCETQTVRILKRDKTPAGLRRVAGVIMTTAEIATRQAEAQQPPPRPIACHSGCSWCCYQHFGATVPEVALLVDHVQAWPKIELARATGRSRAVHQARIGQGLNGWQQTRIPCALLGEDGACLAYPARAIICRAFTSFDAAGCKRLLDGEQASTTGYGPRAQVFAAAGAGILDGLGRVGLRAEMVELNVALAVALTDHEALDKWCRGEDVFKEARI